VAARTDHHLAAFVARPPARLALADLPTPVERAPWLDGAGVEVWIKRDDRTSGLYGGGKVRKLEWLLASDKYGATGRSCRSGGSAAITCWPWGSTCRPRGASCTR
jgi:hypothetical protein